MQCAGPPNGNGERVKDIPTERVIGDPAYLSSHSDHPLQMPDLIDHAP